MSDSSTPTAKKPLLSNTLYIVVKHVAAIILPAASALYFTMAQIWHLPDPEGVIGSIAALNVFLGVVMGVSTVSYNNSDAKYDGTLFLTNQSDTNVPSLGVSVNQHPATLSDKTAATFKIEQN